MNLGKLVETPELRAGQVADPVATGEIVDVPNAPDCDLGFVLTCAIGRDRYFTVKQGAAT